MHRIMHRAATMVAGVALVAGLGSASRADDKEAAPPLNDKCIMACSAEFDRGLDRCRREEADGSASINACVSRARYETEVCRSRCGGQMAGSLECFGQCRRTRTEAVQRCQDREGSGTDGLQQCLEAADFSMNACSKDCEKDMAPEPAAAAPPP